jgi:multidrug efflux pump subunit AcrB
VTFRDMGAAFGVALLGIYILVVAQFGSFRVPLVILTPIPLTFIGIIAGHEVLIEAGSSRFKPILLTALAAMIGAAVILADPIFQGLAISLLFGLASSTLLTVLVIPAIYRVLRT